MDKNRILLAFKDDSDISVFSEYLSGMGFEPAAVKDGARALEHAIQEVPSLIITDLDLPVISGERVFQILRRNPHTSRIPFLFISDTIADIKGFRAGVDIFLLRPLNIEEMYGRIRQTLSMKGASTADASDMEGKLAHMSLADILQFLHLNRKEGELRVSSGAQSGVVFVKGGQVFNAVLDGIEKEKALFRLLQWNDGKFEFIPRAVTATKKIRSTTGSLIMEGMRQIDEFRKKSGQLPRKSSVLKPGKGAASLKGGPPIAHEIMQLLRTHDRAGEIVERCSYPDYEAYCAIGNLISRGIIEKDSAGQAAEGASSEFLTPDQAISIREKIISRFTDMHSLDFGKIFLISTSGRLASGFIEKCARIPGFTLHSSSALSQIAAENPLGETASIRLCGGMELIIFVIPAVRSMGPIWKAFSNNLIGLMLLWDSAGEREIKELVNAKRDIIARRRVPAAQIYWGAGGAHGQGDDEFYKKAFNLRTDEHIFRLDSGDGGMVMEIFYSLFGNLLREDYIAS